MRFVFYRLTFLPARNYDASTAPDFPSCPLLLLDRKNSLNHETMKPRDKYCDLSWLDNVELQRQAAIPERKQPRPWHVKTHMQIAAKGSRPS
jgi:hypothetical protein